MSKDLVAFIAARLAEDEQTALDYQRARLVLTEQYQDDPTRKHVRARRKPLTDAQMAEHRHHFRFDAERVLREVESKRRILARHSQGDNETCQACLTPGMIARGMNCFTLRLLALPFDDYEDFKPEWKP